MAVRDERLRGIEGGEGAGLCGVTRREEQQSRVVVAMVQ
jgi:hypothetical protein